VSSRSVMLAVLYVSEKANEAVFAFCDMPPRLVEERVRKRTRQSSTNFA
jgi:hypothetical protein